MKRGVLALVLGGLVFLLGLATLFVCCENRSLAIGLDTVQREIDNLVLRNARSRAAILGHAAGESDAVDRLPPEIEH